MTVKNMCTTGGERLTAGRGTIFRPVVDQVPRCHINAVLLHSPARGLVLQPRRGTSFLNRLVLGFARSAPHPFWIGRLKLRIIIGRLEELIGMYDTYQL